MLANKVNIKILKFLYIYKNIFLTKKKELLLN
jgi:hypothetical protein